MKSQFSNQTFSSFNLWLDNLIVDKGEGYSNIQTLLYKQDDPARTGYFWASPYKTWVYDSSVTGAIIPSGFYDTNGNFLTKESGIGFDFINGRAFSSTDFGDTLSGIIPHREYNIYIGNEGEVDYMLQQLFEQNNDLSYTETGVAPYKFSAPCVVLTNTSQENTPYAFGGTDLNQRVVRAFIISDNNFSAEAIESLFVDSSKTYFSLIEDEQIPLNENFDLKTGYFNYKDINLVPEVRVARVFSSKLNEKVNRNSFFTISIADFYLEVIRNPRV